MNNKDNLEDTIYNLEKISSTIYVIAQAIFYCKVEAPEERSQSLFFLNESMNAEIEKLKEIWKQSN